MYKKRFVILIVSLLPLIVILTQCLSSKPAVTDPRGENYAGAAACISCHKEIQKSYLHTAHYMASMPADIKTLHGSFKTGFNRVRYNDHTTVLMHKTDSGFFQTSYINGRLAESARMDITMGGVKGESYLYWNENELFQLPVSFDNIQNKWIVSPGYDTVMASYDRSITLRCMECHSSYAREEKPSLPSFSGDVTGFEKSSVILSIDCERCHGGAKQHADFQTANPVVKQARYITRISALTREQKIDICGTCHSGTNTITTRSIFEFKPGDKLAGFKKHAPTAAPLDFEHIDVHGDQLDMLKTSKCFISSKMDCSTCHNNHKNERNDATVYTQRCMNCHTAQDHNFCKLTGRLDMAVLKANCISCHMPALPSKAIINEQKSVLVHTHHVAIYPNEVSRIMNYLKKK